ncbi:hypothetical protein BDZ89DRAFT_1033359 [Hymenopellis radicata]|nr:hypothetical protein BDZ89DRAFT_1033359 [Hymenopellis radicata]
MHLDPIAVLQVNERLQEILNPRSPYSGHCKKLQFLGGYLHPRPEARVPGQKCLKCLTKDILCSWEQEDQSDKRTCTSCFRLKRRCGLGTPDERRRGKVWALKQSYKDSVERKKKRKTRKASNNGEERSGDRADELERENGRWHRTSWIRSTRNLKPGKLTGVARFYQEDLEDLGNGTIVYRGGLYDTKYHAATRQSFFLNRRLGDTMMSPDENVTLVLRPDCMPFLEHANYGAECYCSVMLMTPSTQESFNEMRARRIQESPDAMKEFMPAHGEIPEILIEVTKNLKNDPERFPPGWHKTALSWLDRVFTESFRDIQERRAAKERRAERERRAHPPIKIPVSSLLCASSPSPNLGAEKYKRVESETPFQLGTLPRMPGEEAKMQLGRDQRVQSKGLRRLSRKESEPLQFPKDSARGRDPKVTSRRTPSEAISETSAPSEREASFPTARMMASSANPITTRLFALERDLHEQKALIVNQKIAIADFEHEVVERKRRRYSL